MCDKNADYYTYDIMTPFLSVIPNANITYTFSKMVIVKYATYLVKIRNFFRKITFPHKKLRKINILYIFGKVIS